MTTITKETRKIWLVTKDGSPTHCAWGEVKTWAEAAAHGPRQSWAAALGPDELEADGWDATMTNWRRAPRLVQPGVIERLATPPRVEGRDVVCGGCRFNLDDRGKPHPQATPKSPREPLRPDPIIEDDEALLEAIETYGHGLTLEDKRTGKRVRVALEAQDQVPQGLDAVLFRDRANGKAKRLERASA